MITDIKMPVMNGLEMSKKILKEDPNAKIIIMSAYGQPQYFIQAIEFGVKGFLLKPVNNEKLFDSIASQAKSILLEKELKEQEVKRQEAEHALSTSESILKAVSLASEKFLQYSYGEKSVPEVLSQLGEATNVSRVYIFENSLNKRGNYISTQIYEWAAKGIDSQMDNPHLKDVSFIETGFNRWNDEMLKGNSIYGLVRDFPNEERAALEPQHIISLMVVPIFCDKDWWGFIGFDDCREARSWSEAEIKALSAAADIFGAAIYRRKVEEELLTLNNELELRVSERTRDLQKEVNERKLAETMLRESEEKYRQIFENANDGIILTMKGIIEFTNPKLYEMTGYLPRECIGKSFNDFVHPDFRETTMENYLGRINKKDAPERYDIQILDKQGNMKWIELKSNLIKWENEPTVLTFLTDITERKKTAEELKVLNQKLEQRVREEVEKLEKQQHLLIQKSKLESLGELAAGIAHEINQPLGGISMALDNISIKVGEHAATKEYLANKFRTIFEDIERIRNIINHVRLFSKDHDIIDFETIDVNQVIKDALGMVVSQYKNHNVDLSLKLARYPICIKANKYRLEQVILNLLSNAKYAVDEKEANGSSNSYQKSINIYSKMNETEADVIVEDNGTGIPEEKQVNIFDPFYTTKKNEIGTGLGLSVSYGIIKELGGDILVDSKVAEYTRMIVSIPLNKND
ncbi:MAG: PAS domain S-box protein [Bacteroidota bacterium]|nr:PAS domain S-box protein [Bacteroidota bacterium]